MKNYGRVRSTVRPKPIEIDSYHVYVNSNIMEIITDDFNGYEYNMIQYEKDEYISKLTNEDDAGMLALIISLLMAEIDMLNARVSQLEEVK